MAGRTTMSRQGPTGTTSGGNSHLKARLTALKEKAEDRIPCTCGYEGYIKDLKKEVERLKKERGELLNDAHRFKEVISADLRIIRELRSALEKAKKRMGTMRSICPGCQGCIECDAYDKATREWQIAEQALEISK